MNTISPGQDPTALIEANTTAVFTSNAALKAKRAGNLDEAIRLHSQALEIKLRAYGPEFVQAGISFNGLGETYIAAKRYAEAEEALLKAAKVREESLYGGRDMGPAMDKVSTRESLAQVRESQNDFESAKELRMRGKAEDELLCGHSSVSRSP